MPRNRTLQPALISCALLFWCGTVHAQQASAEALLKGYTKLDTEQATRDAFLHSRGGNTIEWGRWWILAPLPHPKGGKDIATIYEPEHELGSMIPGGKGPDLKKSFPTAPGEQPVTWKEVGDKTSAPANVVDLAECVNNRSIRNSVGYLYRQVVAGSACEVKVHCGSDDGMRLWLNGKLISDVNAERPLDPDAEEITLSLSKGVNHILMKVSQGAGEWATSFRPAFDPDPRIDAALEWRLAQDFPSDEDEGYRLLTIPVPRGVVAEVGGLDILPDGRVVLCTRRGDVYIVSGAAEVPPVDASWRLFASGLQEPLGVVCREDPAAPGKLSMVIAQRGELTRLTDTDSDGVADTFVTLCDRWQISGNYHEYAFGPVYDPAGNAYVNLNLAHTGGETVMGATVPTRGCTVRIAPDGTMTRYADGLRSPDGIGFAPDGQLFYTDNQGDYVATNKLSPLFEGSFQGHQASLPFRGGYGQTWRKDGKPVPTITWPAVWFPYQKMGQSSCGFASCMQSGRFGPFDDQVFVGDQTHCTINRVTLDRITLSGGAPAYQGACYPFRRGLYSGVHRVAFAPDGSLYAGMTDRGWGSTGPKRFGLQRIVSTGKTPLELRRMAPTPHGFTLEFTRPLAADASDAAKYHLSSYTYEYHPDYGSREMETRTLSVTSAALSSDAMTVTLTVEGLREGGMGYVHELHIDGLSSAPGADAARSKLVHAEAYYTLHQIPRN